MYRNNIVIESDLNRHFSRYEDPLWDEEGQEPKVRGIGVSMKIISKDDYMIYVSENNKMIYKVDSTKLTKRQKKFFSSKEGLSFIIEKYKIGVKNISNLKKATKGISC